MPCPAAANDARASFANGRNCAESLLVALADEPGAPSLPADIGAGFTSGIGNTGCVCGALAGGVMVLSASVDDTLEPVARREHAEQLAAEFTERFKAQWGATCCRVLKRGMVEGSNASAEHCARITEFAAATVVDLLAADTGAKRSWAARDLINAARFTALDALAGGALGFAASLMMPAHAAAASVAAGLLVGALVGALAEWRGTGPRRAGRALRSASLLALTVAAVVAVAAPSLGAARAAALASDGLAALTARAAVALAFLVVAFVAAYDFKRYR